MRSPDKIMSNPTLTKPHVLSKKPGRLKSAVQNIVLLFCSILFFLIGLEIILNILAVRFEKAHLKQQEILRRESEFIFYEYDRYLGWKNKPGAEGYFTTPDSKTFVRINSKGLRDKEYDYKKPEGIFRILVLGDSFTWGYGVEQGKNFTDRLEELLSASVEVINAGVSGYGTDQELLLLEREGMKYEPDLILVAFASNDFMLDNQSGHHGYYLKPYFIIENGELKPMNELLPELNSGQWEEILKNWKPDEKTEKRKGLKGFLKYRTKTYPFLSEGLKNLRYSVVRNLSMNPTTEKWFSDLRLKLNREDINLDVTKKIFLRMNETAVKGGAKLAVFVVPYKSALEKLPNPHIYDFLDFFKNAGIPAVYPYESFHREFKRSKKLFLNQDDHWTEEGHELAAESLKAFLEAGDLLK